MLDQCTSEILSGIIVRTRARFLHDTRRMPNGCLEWVGRRIQPRKGLRTVGYGTLTIGGRSWTAHRAAWDLFVGAIPPGMLVLHRCDNPPCVDWENHLWLGTHADNLHDAMRKGRFTGAKPGPNRSRVLTDEQVAEIRASTSFNQKELAARYGVHQSTVSKIVRNRARRTV